MPGDDRVVVTGLAINTPLSDTLAGTLEALLAGRSAVTRWTSVDSRRCLSKIGADLGAYDVLARAATLGARLPARPAERLNALIRRAPWSTRLGLLLAADAALHAGLEEAELASCAVVVAGHNLMAQHVERGFERFTERPDGLEVGHELYSLDTTQAACVSELFGSPKAAYTVGGACASGNLGLLAGAREIRHHGVDRVLVIGAVPELAPGALHAFGLIGALSIGSFNEAPERASRPWDLRREGFVPAHGGAAMLLERRPAALARGATLWAELRGVGVCSDANHLTVPDADGQSRAMTLALRRAGLPPEAIGYVSAHATSTPQGDLVELEAIRRALGPHAEKVPINATKSMIGHTFNAAALTEGVAAILQMHAGRLHGTLNLEAPDPAAALDLCAGGPRPHAFGALMNNAFGFGGINAVSVFTRGEA